MRFPEALGIVSTIIIVGSVILLLSEYTMPTILEKFLLDVPFAVIVALFVWYLTTKSDRENRKYTRGRIANSYLVCIAISGALISVPQNRIHIDSLMNMINQKYDEIKKRAELHAHLLYANEIDNFDREQIAIHDLFDFRIRTDPQNVPLLQEFYDFLRNILSSYVVKHKLKEFNEYVVGQ